MINLAIQGHATRGKEVIEILEMLGGKDVGYSGIGSQYYYYIDEYGNIAGTTELPESKTFVTYTLEELLEKFPYKVGDKVIHDGEVLPIIGMKWDFSRNIVIYTLKHNYGTIDCYDSTWIKPYKEELKEAIKIAIPKGYEFSEVNNQHVVFTKIQPQYPKTYEECHKLMVQWKEYDCNPNSELILCEAPIHDFCKLIVARNIYWKLAGEQMGLGKPWEPDFKDECDKYFICYLKDEIWKSNIRDCNRFLVFPTEKIRDEFYENFKSLIERCKELL